MAEVPTTRHTLGTYARTQHTQPAHTTLWWTQLECALHSDQLTRGHIRMGTAPSQPHSPSQHSLPTTHCTLHACTPLSAASHMTTLLGGWSLGWLVGSFAGDAPTPLTYHKGGGDHLTPSALRGPHPPEWTSTGGHTIVIGMCACVCCVCGPLVPVLLLQLTGLWQSGADTNPPYSLSECDPRVVYTLWCTVGGALPGQGHLMHSSLAAKPSSSHECLVVLGWRKWEEGGGGGEVGRCIGGVGGGEK